MFSSQSTLVIFAKILQKVIRGFALYLYDTCYYIMHVIDANLDDVDL